MSRDHFSKIMHSPYFQSEAYRETPGGKAELVIEKKVIQIKEKIMFWKRTK